MKSNDIVVLVNTAGMAALPGAMATVTSGIHSDGYITIIWGRTDNQWNGQKDGSYLRDSFRLATYKEKVEFLRRQIQDLGNQLTNLKKSRFSSGDSVSYDEYPTETFEVFASDHESNHYWIRNSFRNLGILTRGDRLTLIKRK